MSLIKREMRLFIMLLGFWMILAGEFTLRQWITGILSSILTIGIYYWVLKNSGADRVKWIRFRVVVQFSVILLLEIFKSAFHHLLRVVRGHGDTGDCRLLLAVREELAITLVANAITLTPGTVTLEADDTVLRVLYYGDFPKQCPLDLVLMVEGLQKPLLKEELRRQEVEHA